MRIFVGNLPWAIHDDSLRDLFAPYGNVTSATVMVDRETGRSKGFGFVEMPEASEAQTAIAALNGKDVSGRPLTVNEARPREARTGGGRAGGGMGDHRW
ncbi:MAG: RNA-binding protein [SAR202 cluster bacterium]|nr:RNA-binding protein [SAR202 cluster bacterium]